MEIKVKSTEQIDDLLVEGRKILQEKNGYHFTSDSVRLAKFVETNKNAKICEFCAGSGIISILLAIDGAKNIKAIELQENLANLCKRNVEINSFENEIEVLCQNVVNAHKLLGCEIFDAIVCNPPFEKNIKNIEKNSINIAKFEFEISLKQIVEEANKLLKFKGKLFLVIPAKRLFELDSILNENNFKIKNCKIFSPKQIANTVYVCAVKGAKDGAKIEIY